jgi:hypothetical protein
MEIVALFLACGTDPAIRNHTGLTAEDCARRMGLMKSPRQRAHSG